MLNFKPGILTFIFLLILVTSFQQIQAQPKDSIKYNSIHIRAGHYLLTGSKYYYFRHDTIINLPVLNEFSVIDSTEYNRRLIYSRIEKYSSGSKFLKEILPLVILPPQIVVESPKLSFQEAANPFRYYRGKIIRNIRLIKLPVFGSSVNDTNLSQYKSWVVETGNRSHINTKDYIIRKNLIFKKGDKVDPILLADNERILREMSSIEDARIILKPVKHCKDSVDVIIVTRDVWSIGVDGAINNANGFNISVYDKNLLGFNHELDNKLLFDYREKPATGYMGHFGIRNFSGSFVDMDFSYNDDFGNKLYDMKFNRPFITKKIKWGGGMELMESSGNQDYFVSDTQVVTVPVKYDFRDVWVGKIFLLKDYISTGNLLQMLILSGRFQYKNYLVCPIVTPDSNQQFYNTKLLLGNITIMEHAYYRSNMIYGYGRTEDIPYGEMLRINAGAEISDYYTRFYGSVSVLRARYINKIGYYLYTLSYGGYFHNSGIENGAFNIRVNTVSELFRISNFKLRQFVNINYMLGINRYASEKININNDNGIRGFNTNILNGIQKLVINIETVSFLPFSFYEFKFAVYGFTDIAGLGKSTGNIFNNKFYTGFGIGFRMRNENLVFRTFEVRFAFYPEITRDMNSFLLDVADKSNLGIYDFASQPPGIIEYK